MRYSIHSQRNHILTDDDVTTTVSGTHRVMGSGVDLEKPIRCRERLLLEAMIRLRVMPVVVVVVAAVAAMAAAVLVTVVLHSTDVKSKQFVCSTNATATAETTFKYARNNQVKSDFYQPHPSNGSHRGAVSRTCASRRLPVPVFD